MNRMTRTLLVAGVSLALPLAALADTPAPTPTASTTMKSAAKPMHQATAAHQTTTTMKTGSTPAATGSATATPMKTAKKPAATTRWVDLNNATRDQLMGVSGVTGEVADAIIAGRPYASKAQLIDKKVVDAKTYRKISKYLTAKPMSNGTGQ